MKMLMKMKMDRLGAVNETIENSGTEAKWRRLEVAVDSGACDSVINPDELPDHTREGYGCVKSRRAICISHWRSHSEYRRNCTSRICG